MNFPLSFLPETLDKNELEKLMLDLDVCPLKNSGKKVIKPVGDCSSGIMLIGEAPGAKEDEMGEPFVGAAGKLLNNLLLPSVGLNRQNIYLTNIVKCRPPNNRDPLPEEKDAWSHVLVAEILTYRPTVIACLGRHSGGFFLPDLKISQDHGKPKEIELFPDFKQNILPLYHPAVALYNPNKKEVLLEDFQILKDFLRPEFLKNREESEVNSVVEGALF